jgi:hypothetical protein
MTNQESRFAPVSTTIFRLVLKPECGLDGIRLFDIAGQRGGKGARMRNGIHHGRTDKISSRHYGRGQLRSHRHRAELKDRPGLPRTLRNTRVRAQMSGCT